MADRRFISCSRRWSTPKDASKSSESAPSADGELGRARSAINEYFRTFHAAFACDKRCQALVALSFLCYTLLCALALAGHVQCGLLAHNLVPYDTSSYKYLSLYERYFTRYGGARAELLVSGRLQIERRDVRARLVAIVAAFERTPHSTRTDHFWLRQMEQFASQEHVTLDANSTYAFMMRDFFREYPQYKYDVLHERDDHNGTPPLCQGRR